MQFFFPFAECQNRRVNEMSENGLSMVSDLRLWLHINIVHSRRKERQYSWLAHISRIKKYLEGIFADCEIMVIHWGEMINKLSTFLGLFARKKESITYSKGYWASDIEIKGSLHVIIGLSFRFCEENIF